MLTRLFVFWGVACLGLGHLGCSVLGNAGLDRFQEVEQSLESTGRSVDQQQAQQKAQQQCDNDDEFAWIPGGEFIYGSDRAERDYAYHVSARAIATTPEAIDRAEQQLRSRRWFEREPQRQVRSLSGFCLQRNLVTNADYREFVQATAHRLPHISEQDYQTQGFLVHPYATVKTYLWHNGTYPEGQGAHPVVLVSYDDAQAYAQWKGIQDNANYRLPTAEEWEKAARGRNGQYFAWGNEWMDEATNWASTAQLAIIPGMTKPGTSAIATFPISQSIYGVEDMAGNVFEYTSTLRNRRGRRSVMKGCSWDDLPGFCRAAYDHTRPIASRHILFGFRLVKL